MRERVRSVLMDQNCQQQSRSPDLRVHLATHVTRDRDSTGSRLQSTARVGTLERSIREVFMLLSFTVRGAIVEIEVLRSGVFLKLGGREWWWDR
jgi:hypothetical protein